MKLGKEIPWIEIFTNWLKFLMMLILWRHQNATAKNWRVLRIFAEYLKGDLTDFHQTVDILGNRL